VKDAAVLGISELKLNKQLKKQEFQETIRFEKNLLVKVGKNIWVAFRFGMTGSLKYFKENEETPKYAKVIYHFKNKYCLSFVNRRKFGTVGLVAAEAPVFVLPIKKNSNN
jgi:formamidopyrimidine-DNA glycosylase